MQRIGLYLRRRRRRRNRSERARLRSSARAKPRSSRRVSERAVLTFSVVSVCRFDGARIGGHWPSFAAPLFTLQVYNCLQGVGMVSDMRISIALSVGVA